MKDQVYAALAEVFENVTDQYPTDWATLPAVEYIDKEEKAYVRYRVDIWDDHSTSESALKVDEALAGIGLVRTLCRDAPEPEKYKHKVMRYETIIDVFTDDVYWPN